MKYYYADPNDEVCVVYYDEERKAYYRECIEKVVKGNNPYASVDIKCNAETRNKLSADTETKKKLKME